MLTVCTVICSEQEKKDNDIPSVLVRVTIAVIKHHDQKQLGEQSVYIAYISTL